jgi:hypothetical protein
MKRVSIDDVGRLLTNYISMRKRLYLNYPNSILKRGKFLGLRYGSSDKIGNDIQGNGSWEDNTLV